MRLALVMEMVVDKDVDVKVDEEVDVEVDCEVFEEVALKRNSPHKDQWMRMLVFAKQRQLEAAKIILCASAHLPSTKTRVT